MIECNACGEKYDDESSLKICPWCEGTKCEHCDMGDNCACMACEEE